MLKKIGVIGGSGLETMLEGRETVEVETEYGRPPPIAVGTISNHEVCFVPRHGARHEVPPHKVNYRAIILGLRHVGAERIIATNAVGAMNQEYAPGDIAIPLDIIDFTKSRPITLHDNGPVTHVDMTEPYCPSLRKALIESSKSRVERVWTDSVIVCTDGPRFETPAEIKMFRHFGCDLVGMTSAPEVFLAKEAGLCYASICFVSNMAAGLQTRISRAEVEDVASRMISQIRAIVSQSIITMRNAEPCTCRESCGG